MAETKKKTETKIQTDVGKKANDSQKKAKNAVERDIYAAVKLDGLPKSVVENIRKSMAKNIGMETLQQDTVALQKKSQSLYDRYKNDEYVDPTEYDDLISQTKALQDRYGKYRQYVSTFSPNEDSSSIQYAIDGFTSSIKGFGSLKDYYARFSDADDFNTQIAQAKEYERLLNYDLEAGKTNVEAARQKYEEQKAKEDEKKTVLEKIYDSLPKYNGAKIAAPVVEADTELGQLQQQYQALLNEYNLAEKAQYMRDAESAMEREDFVEKSAFVAPESLKDDIDFAYSVINGKTSNISNQDRYRLTEILDVAKNMTEEEKRILNYIYNEVGKEEATEYLNSVRDTVAYRNAQKTKKILDSITPDNFFGEMLEVPLYGAAAFVGGFSDAGPNLVAGLFNKEIPTSSSQYLQQMMQQDGNAVSKFSANLGQSIGNMMPSIIISSAMSYAGVPGGDIVGAAAMGFQARGAAYNEALRQGYTKEQASLYGSVNGALEGSLQYALGGISKLGGNAIGKLSPKLSAKLTGAIQNINSATGRFLANHAVSMASEALEEGLQAVIDPYVRRAILNEDAKIDWGEVGYSALLGAASAGFLEINSNLQESKLSQADMESIKTKYDIGNSAEKLFSLFEEERAVTLRAVTNLVSENKTKEAQKTIDAAMDLERRVAEYAKRKYGDVSFSTKTGARLSIGETSKQAIRQWQAVRAKVSDGSFNAASADASLRESSNVWKEIAKQSDKAAAALLNTNMSNTKIEKNVLDDPSVVAGITSLTGVDLSKGKTVSQKRALFRQAAAAYQSLTSSGVLSQASELIHKNNTETDAVVRSENIRGAQDILISYGRELGVEKQSLQNERKTLSGKEGAVRREAIDKRIAEINIQQSMLSNMRNHIASGNLSALASLDGTNALNNAGTIRTASVETASTETAESVTSDEKASISDELDIAIQDIVSQLDPALVEELQKENGFVMVRSDLEREKKSATKEEAAKIGEEINLVRRLEKLLEEKQYQLDTAGASFRESVIQEVSEEYRKKLATFGIDLRYDGGGDLYFDENGNPLTAEQYREALSENKKVRVLRQNGYNSERTVGIFRALASSNVRALDLKSGTFRNYRVGSSITVQDAVNFVIGHEVVHAAATSGRGDLIQTILSHIEGTRLDREFELFNRRNGRPVSEKAADRFEKLRNSYQTMENQAAKNNNREPIKVDDNYLYEEIAADYMGSLMMNQGWEEVVLRTATFGEKVRFAMGRLSNKLRKNNLDTRAKLVDNLATRLERASERTYGNQEKRVAKDDEIARKKDEDNARREEEKAARQAEQKVEEQEKKGQTKEPDAEETSESDADTMGKDRVANEKSEASTKGNDNPVHYYLSYDGDVTELSNNDVSSLKEQLKEHLDEVNAIDPVDTVAYDPVNKKELKERALSEFKKFGYVVDRQGFGKIEIGEKQIANGLNYLNNEAEKAALLAVPKVLKRGVEISGHGNHKGRRYATVTIAAPVSINGKVGNVVVAVRKTGNNRYYTHRILLPNGAEFVFEKNKNAELTSADMPAHKNGEGPAIGSASETSIPQKKENVNTKLSLSSDIDSDGNALSVDQAEFFLDSKVRDADGNLLKVRHGTDAEFDIFDFTKTGKNGRAEGYGFYFSDDPEITNRYGEKQKEVYLNITKPLYNNRKTVTKAELIKLTNALIDFDVQKYADDGLTWQDSFLSNYVMTYDMSRAAAVREFVNTIWEANDNDQELVFEVAFADGRAYDNAGMREFYDVLTESTGYDGVIAEWKHKDGSSNVYVTFRSEQSKYTSNKTPSQNPDLRYSIAGIESETADYTEFDSALRKYNDGEGMEKIRKQTGWWLGKDGKWRYEISDKDMEFERDGFVKNPKTVGDYVKHEKLFKAYPGLKDIKVQFVNRVGNSDVARGVFSAKKDTIFIKKTLPSEQAKKTMLHELQHAIQNDEGFKRGSSFKNGAMLVFNELYDAVKDYPRFQSYQSPALKMQYVMAMSDVLLGNSHGDLARKAYYNDHGETEARAAVERMDMTDEDLRNTPYFNDGIVTDNNQIKQNFIDNLIEIGYTERKAKQIAKEGIQYDYQLEDDAKPDGQRSSWNEGDAEGDRRPYAERNYARSNGSQSEIHGTGEISDSDAVAGKNGGRVSDGRITESEDTRYSLFFEEETPGLSYEKLQSDVENAEDLVRKVTAGLLSQRGSVDAVGVATGIHKMLTTLSATVDSDEITADAKSLLDYIIRNTKNGEKPDGAVIDEVVKRSREIAEKIFQDTVDIDATAREYQEVGDLLRKTQFYVPEDKRASGFSSFGGYNEFRVKHFRDARLSKDGVGKSVSEFYHELAEAYPELFPDSITDEAEQAIHIAELSHEIHRLDMNSLSESVFGRDIILDLQRAIVNLLSNPRSQAAKDFSIAVEIENTARKIEKLSESYETRTDRLYKKFGDKIQKASEGQKKAHQKKMIRKRAKTMMKRMVKPSEKNHVPQEILEETGEFLSSLLWSNKNQDGRDMNLLAQKTREAIYRAKNAAAASQSVDNSNNKLDLSMTLAPSLVSDMKSFKGKEIDELPLDELKQLNRIVQAISFNIRRYNDAISYSGNLANRSEKAMQRLALRKKSTDPNVVARETIISKILGGLAYTGKVLKQKASFLFVDARAYADILNIPELSESIDSLGKAQDNFYRYFKQMTEEMQAIVGNVPREWREGVISISLDSGTTIDLTQAQLMSFYLLTKQAQSRRRLLNEHGGGISSSVIQGKTKTKEGEVRHFTEGDLDRVVSKLDPEAKKIADEISELLNGTIAAIGNSASLKNDGYVRFVIENYFPMTAAVRDGTYDEANQVQHDVIMDLQSMLKERKETDAVTLRIDDVFAVMNRHILSMAQYAAYSGPIRDLFRLMRVRPESGDTLQNTIKRQYGTEAAKVVDKLILALQGQQIQADHQETLGEKLLSKWKASQVMLSLSTILKQPISILRALPEFQIKNSLHKPLVLFSKTYNNEEKQMLEMNPIAGLKEMGFSEYARNRSVEEFYNKNAKTWKEKLQDKAGYLAEKMDLATLTNIWYMSKLENTKDGKVDYEAAKKKFRLVVERTQVVQTALTSAIGADSNIYLKMMFAFKNEPFKQLNYLRSAVANFDPQNPQTVKKLATVTLTFLLSTLTEGLVSNIFRVLRSEEDDEEEFLTNVLSDLPLDMLLDMLSTVTLMSGDLIDAGAQMFKGYDPKRTDYSLLADLVKAGRSLYDSFGNESKNSRLYLVTKFAKAASSFFGIPLKNLVRYIETPAFVLANTFEGTEFQYDIKKWIYNIEGYNTSAKKEFQSVLASAIDRENFDDFASIRKDLRSHGFSEKDIQTAVGNSDRFYNAFNEGPAAFREEVAKVKKYDSTMTSEYILESLKDRKTQLISNLYDAAKSGDQKAIDTATEEILQMRDVDKKRKLTKQEVKDLLKNKVLSSLKTKLKESCVKSYGTSYYEKDKERVLEEFKEFDYITSAYVDRLVRELK